MLDFKQFRFAINPRITLLAAIFFPLMLSLGFWQLGRAEEKQALLSDYEKQIAKKPVEFEKSIASDSVGDFDDYRRVVASGIFDTKRYWLLEAKFFRGQLGYQVLMPMQVSNDRWLLVNRGWVRGSRDRSVLPSFPTAKGEVEVSGMLKRPSDTPFVSESQSFDSQWPKLIVEVDTALMSKQMAVTLPEKVLLIDQESPSALETEWQIINIKPAKHHGYAVQWFCMAAALAILWLHSNSNVYHFLRKALARENTE